MDEAVTDYTEEIRVEQESGEPSSDTMALDESATGADATTQGEAASEQAQNYTQAKARLDEIVKQVRAKDVSLERSLDLLEEGVKLANQCTELIDQTRWDEEPQQPQDDAEEGAAPEGSEDAA